MVGPPNEAVYDYVSQTNRAGNLKGKLLLVHGTRDTAVPLFHKMKMVRALNDAGKSYELLILPGSHHFSFTPPPIETSRVRQFLMNHLNS